MSEDFGFVNGLDERYTFGGEVSPDSEILPVEKLGKGLTLIEEHKAQLTKERSEEILNIPSFVIEDDYVDRALKDDHVNYLINCAKRGTFHPEWVQLITCICDEAINGHRKGTEFRMNGQHTCWMRQYMPNDWPCEVRFMKYRAKTLNDMRRLYASIDRGAARTLHNVLNAYLAGTEQFHGIPGDVRRLVAGGFVFWKSGERVSKMDGDDIAYRIQTENVELTKIVANFLMTTRGKEHRACFRRRAVVAAMYETFNVLKLKGADFWAGVRDGVGMDSRQDPRLKLRTHLMLTGGATASDARASNGARPKSAISQEDTYRKCIAAWNLWRAGQPCQMLKAGGTPEKRPTAR